jgi:hypothetical protein
LGGGGYDRHGGEGAVDVLSAQPFVVNEAEHLVLKGTSAVGGGGGGTMKGIHGMLRLWSLDACSGMSDMTIVRSVSSSVMVLRRR